jgi:serine/threonine-protein kinase HipA
MSEPLVVSISGISAGLLEPNNEGSFFQLDESYLRLPNRPVLGQIFEDDPGRPYRTRQGVPAWFANLLPEGPLRHLIAERAGVHEARSFFLLQLLGHDLPGAVAIQPSGGQPADEHKLKDPQNGNDEQLKFSLAGVQMKFSAIQEERGLTIPTSGLGGDWIVKLPDRRFDGVPENEFSMMEFARQSGINVPEIELVPAKSITGLPEEVSDSPGNALAVKRFDRTPEGRVHIEDFAQVLNLSPRRKYGATNFDTIGHFVGATCPTEDLDEFLRRLVFMLAIGNSDAHAKNWSLIYPDGRSTRLAPAYDLVAISYYETLDRRLSRKLALKLAGASDPEEVDKERFRRFAERIEIDEDHVLGVVSEQVDRIQAVWDDLTAEPPAGALNPDVAKVIQERLQTLPLFR